MAETALDLLVHALEERDCRPRGRNGKWEACCPSHDDRVASLSVSEGRDGRVLIFCHAGCTVEEIVGVLGLKPSDLFERANGRPTFRPPTSPEAARTPQSAAADGFEPPSDADLDGWREALTDAMLDRLQEVRGWAPEAARKLNLGFDGDRIVFPVRDAAGRLVGVSRFAPNPARRGGPKMKADAGSTRAPFPAVETLPDGQDIWIVEGEPDAVAGATLGLATVSVPGANGWRPEHAARFAGRRVVVVGDCDRQGRALAEKVAGDLASHAADVRAVDLDPSRTDGHDLGDLLREAGEEGRDELRRLLERTAGEAKRVRATPPDGASAVPAAQVAREQVEWLWDGRVPRGSLTLLAGVPKLGKSLLTCLLAADVSRAGGTAILATAEDALGAVVRPRLEAVDAALDRVRFVQMRRDGVEVGITLPDDVADLERLVRDHGARLVVIDPLMAHLPGTVNAHRDQDVRRALAPLHRLAEATGCAVVVVAHLNKGAGSDPMMRIGGSVGIQGAARSVLLLSRDPDDLEGERGDGRVLAHLACNLAELAPSLRYAVEPAELPDGPTARLRHVGESQHSGRDLLAPALEGEERSATDEATDFLRAELADGAQPARKMQAGARSAGLSDKALRRARERLGIRPAKSGFDGGWEWSLPQDAPPSEDGGAPSVSAEGGHLRANPLPERDSAGPQATRPPEGAPFPDKGTFDALEAPAAPPQETLGEAPRDTPSDADREAWAAHVREHGTRGDPRR